MASQILGALAAIAGVLYLFVVFVRKGCIFQEPMLWLTGVVLLMAGLLLGALGRIESAIQPLAASNPPPRVLAVVLVGSVLVVAVALVVIWFFLSIAAQR
jgi:hypothetical protein